MFIEFEGELYKTDHLTSLAYEGIVRFSDGSELVLSNERASALRDQLCQTVPGFLLIERDVINLDAITKIDRDGFVRFLGRWGHFFWELYT